MRGKGAACMWHKELRAVLPEPSRSRMSLAHHLLLSQPGVCSQLVLLLLHPKCHFPPSKCHFPCLGPNHCLLSGAAGNFSNVALIYGSS